MSVRKLPIIGVFGSGSAISPERATLAREAGAAVARLGAHLLTGAGFGVMAAAGEGFTAVADRRGLSIGVIPRHPHGGFDEPNAATDGTPYPNPFVEIPVFTPLPPRVTNWHDAPSRNHVNVLTVDACLVLPGGPGTRNELDMAMYYRSNAKRPSLVTRTILLGPPEEFPAESLKTFVRVASVAEASERLEVMLDDMIGHRATAAVAAIVS